MPNLRAWTLALALSLLLPAHLAAQACLGSGAAPGQGYAAGAASFTDGAWAMGGELGGNLEGPVSLEAGASHTLYDNTDAAVTAVSGAIAADVTPAGTSFSACPLASVSYQWLSDDAGTALDADGVVLGGGLAVGAEVEARSGLRFIPRAAGAVVHNRATVSAGGASATGSETYGSFSGALLLAGESVYAGPSASVTTVEGADPVFSVILGFTF